jgi:ATP-dependent DNA helicase DinG
VLHRAAIGLLQELAARGTKRDPDAAAIAWTMAQAGWSWGPSVLAALDFRKDESSGRSAGLRVWERLADWSSQPPPSPPGTEAVNPAEARTRLGELLGDDAEARPQQADYASAVTQAFTPRETEGEPTVVLAEAGTGVGKTLGYIAPASLWAERNRGPVWISTYTRNLQHQIDGELDRLYPEPGTKAAKVVIRKGRENYLCLLNYQDTVQSLAARPRDAVAVGLMARWAGPTLGLTDRRGECIYSACAHYGKCFIERSIRRARRAEVVVANHALVMIQATLGSEDGMGYGHLVFDEGHHLFDAADSAFAAHLSGRETAELRRWLLGSEAGRRGAGRARGLERRLEDLIAGDDEAKEMLTAAETAARALAGEGWRQRLTEDKAQGPCEAFLIRVRQQVYARARGAEGPYSLETETKPPVPGLLEAAAKLEGALERLHRPLTALNRRLAGRLDDEADDLDGETRRRIEAVCRGLRRRALLQITAWRDMLRGLEEEVPAAFVDWFAVERIDGRDLDVGQFRHWIDPTVPFAEAVVRPSQGLVVTSATLTDGSGDPEADWAAAELRSGAAHLPKPAIRAQVASPFDYGAQTRVLIVNDVRKDRLDQVGAAYRSLFLAAGGGGLGLFTAITRLRAVHGHIAEALDQAGLPLYGQHVDRLDTATLVEIFRSEENACLLGTDAVRDGIDVPGRSLRLIVFDRVPWPRPDLRHRARREAFGGRRYDDLIARLRLKQAYGRLIRRADDRGVFVLLDPMMPSRLLGAFPEGVTAERVGLAEAVAETRSFLAER